MLDWLIDIMNQTRSATLVKIAVGMLALNLYACEAPQDAGGSSARSDYPQVSQPIAGSPTRKEPAWSTLSPPTAPELIDAGRQEPVSTFVDARPAAMIDGQPVTWGELRPAMSDIAGAEALREHIIDRKLSDALSERGIVITPDDVAAERKLLLESLSDDPNTAIRLLEELRARQLLGKSRFEALLQRNAGLRAMIRNDVKVDESAVKTMHDIVHGPKRQARIMVLPNLSSAQAAINLVNSGASFADVAVEMSSDSSAARGGLLEPVSSSDPNYPESIRQTIFSLNTGEMSGPVLVGDKYAVVLLVKRLAADGVTVEDARASLERMVRVSQERLLMDQALRRLTLDTTVTVFDEQLNESWQRARRGN